MENAQHSAWYAASTPSLAIFIILIILITVENSGSQ